MDGEQATWSELHILTEHEQECSSFPIQQERHKNRVQQIKDLFSPKTQEENNNKT